MPKKSSHTKSLTHDDVRHLAKLSALQLTDDEIALYTKQFDETLEYVENMSQIDTSSVSKASHMSGLTNVFFNDGLDCERQLTQDEATTNSSKHRDGYFVVEKIM